MPLLLKGFTPFTPDSAKSKIGKISKITKLKNKQDHAKALLNSFPTNGHTSGFFL